VTCDGPVSAVASSARACCSPDAGFSFGHLRARRVDGGFLRLGGGRRRLELLLRHLVLRQQTAQPFDVARRLGGVRLRLAQPRLRGRQPRARRLDLLFRGGDTTLGLRDAAARRRDVAGGGGRRNRDVALRSDRRGLRVGELRARLVDRHLVVARIELDQRRAGLDDLIVVDRDARHRAADARRDLRDERIHLRIVGRLAARGEPQPDADAGEREEDRADPQKDARLLHE
jgi:hypothetical protein